MVNGFEVVGSEMLKIGAGHLRTQDAGMLLTGDADQVVERIPIHQLQDVIREAQGFEPPCIVNADDMG